MNVVKASTDVYAVIGSPIKHSLSPSIYNFAFEKLDIDAVYVAFEVEQDAVGSAVGAFRTLGIKGVNVTTPCKSAVVPFVDRLSAEAEVLGAVNLIKNDNGVLMGYNTDGKGMVNAFENVGYSAEGRSISIFGTGGAAVSVIVAFAFAGASKIRIFSRKTKPDPALAGIISHLNKLRPGCVLQTINYSQTRLFNEAVESSDYLINTTPLGMRPNDDKTIIEDASLLRPHHVVADAVYNPLETRLLREAKLAGCKTIDGTKMLLWQAAEGFQILTGKVLPTEEIANEILPK